MEMVKMYTRKNGTRTADGRAWKDQTFRITYSNNEKERSKSVELVRRYLLIHDKYNRWMMAC